MDVQETQNNIWIYYSTLAYFPVLHKLSAPIYQFTLRCSLNLVCDDGLSSLAENAQAQRTQTAALNNK